MPAVDPATKALRSWIRRPVSRKSNWIPRPQIGCATNASPGLHIRTQYAAGERLPRRRDGVPPHQSSARLSDLRPGGRSARLQEQSTGYGWSRLLAFHRAEKREVETHAARAACVMLDDERCILCSRCIRFSKEIANADDVLGFVDRGAATRRFHLLSGQEAREQLLRSTRLTSAPARHPHEHGILRFKMRVWFLKQTNSLDTESSVGANTSRLVPRRR